MPTGRLMKNTHRQLAYSTSRPPASTHGRTGPGDGRPHPQRPLALGALEGGSDDGQRRRRQQRRAHALAGAHGDQDRPGLGQARGQRGDGEYAEPARNIRRRPSVSASRPPSSSSPPNQSM